MDIGLVLSGGMAKGAYQIGALKAIKKFIDPCDIKVISCSSIGVLNGYSFVTNKLQLAEKMWKNLCNNDNRSFINSVLRSSYLQQSITSLCNKKDKIPMPFFVSLLNFKERTITYNNLENIEPSFYPVYLRASVAMPIYNRAITINNQSFYDGAMVDNIPVFPLIKQKLDYIICIYFDDCCYTFENPYFDNKVVKITYPSKKTIIDSLSFNKESIEQMISYGYETAHNILQPIFVNYPNNIDCIYKYINFLNDTMGRKKLRITGDVLVTNINKVAQKLAKHKIKY